MMTTAPHALGEIDAAAAPDGLTVALAVCDLARGERAGIITPVEYRGAVKALAEGRRPAGVSRYRRVGKDTPGAVEKHGEGGRTWWIDAEQARREAEAANKQPRPKAATKAAPAPKPAEADPAEAVKARVAELAALPEVTPAHVEELASLMHDRMTVAQLNAFKKAHALKASGPKKELAGKLARGALEAARAKSAPSTAVDAAPRAGPPDPGALAALIQHARDNSRNYLVTDSELEAVAARLPSLTLPQAQGVWRALGYHGPLKSKADALNKLRDALGVGSVGAGGRATFRRAMDGGSDGELAVFEARHAGAEAALGNGSVEGHVEATVKRLAGDGAVRNVVAQHLGLGHLTAPQSQLDGIRKRLTAEAREGFRQKREQMAGPPRELQPLPIPEPAAPKPRAAPRPDATPRPVPVPRAAPAPKTFTPAEESQISRAHAVAEDLYDRALDRGLTPDVIRGQTDRLASSLSKSALDEVAKRFGIAGHFGSKQAALNALAGKILDRKNSHARAGL